VRPVRRQPHAPSKMLPRHRSALACPRFDGERVRVGALPSAGARSTVVVVGAVAQEIGDRGDGAWRWAVVLMLAPARPARGSCRGFDG